MNRCGLHSKILSYIVEHALSLLTIAQKSWLAKPFHATFVAATSAEIAQLTVVRSGVGNIGDDQKC